MADINTGFYPQANPNGLLGTAEQAMAIRNLGAQNALLGIDVQQNRQNLAQQQLGYLSQNLGLLAKDPNLTSDKAMALGQRFVQEGVLSPQVWATEAANIQATGGDPAKLRPLLQNYSQRALDAVQQFQTTYGAPSTQNTGSSIVAGNTNPFTGAFTPASSTQQGMTPGDANSLVTITLPDGTTQQVTKAQSVQMLNGGGNPLTQGAAPQSGGNALTSAAPNPSAPSTSQAPIPGIAAPSPQQQAMFSQSAAQYQAAKNSDSNYQANLVPLEKSLSLLPNTPLFGKGAQIPTDVAQVLNTFGIPIGSDQAKNASELDKYLTQVARGSGAAAGSDQQLLAAFSANPNMNTNKAAATDVIKTMIALQRMQHSIVADADAQGIKPEGYSDFARRMGSSLDPRAFGVDLMDDQAKAALLKDLEANPAAKAKFAQSLRAAAQAGVLGDGGGQ